MLAARWEGTRLVLRRSAALLAEQCADQLDHPPGAGFLQRPPGEFGIGYTILPAEDEQPQPQRQLLKDEESRNKQEGVNQ